LESVLRKEESPRLEGFVKQVGFKWEMKDWGSFVDSESVESREEDDVTGVGRGESEIERLGWRWRREVGSWFQRDRDAYRKERSVIRNEDDVGGRARVTRDEERVLREGWTEMRWWRYGGLVVVRTLLVSGRRCYSMRSFIFEPVIQICLLFFIQLSSPLFLHANTI